MKKRVFCLFLCMLMCFSLLPTWAFAEGEQPEEDVIVEEEIPAQEPPAEEAIPEEAVPEEAIPEEVVVEEEGNPVFETVEFEEIFSEEPMGATNLEAIRKHYNNKGTVDTTATGGIRKAFDGIKETFPEEKYWNHKVSSSADVGSHSEKFQYSITDTPCANHSGSGKVGQYDCNFFDGACQCQGFARKVYYDIFGSKVGNLSNLTTTDKNIREGDFISLNLSPGHFGIVYSINRSASTFTMIECNAYSLSDSKCNCIINYGRYNYKFSQIRGYKHALNYDMIMEQNTTPTVAKSGTYNGHTYERYDSSVSWKTAKAFCENKGGHLVTIADAKENAWITNTLLSGCAKNIYFIGGTDTSGSWKWITGESFSYSNWDQDRPEPSNDSGEDYAAIMGKKVGNNKSPGEWIDIFDNGDSRYTGYSLSDCGFICEYEPPAPAAPNAPSVNVSGQSVKVSWNNVAYETSYDVYLVQSPWTWNDIKYHAGVGADVTSHTFTNVAYGAYKAFVISRPNKDAVQSGWTDALVEAPSPAEQFTVDPSLNLHDTIGISFYLKPADGLDLRSITANVSYASKYQTVNRDFPLAGMSPNSAGEYFVKAIDAASDEMSDTVTLTVKRGSTEIFRQEYSIASIAASWLNDGKHTRYDALLRAMLQYGDKAQGFFGNHSEQHITPAGAPALVPIPAAYAPGADPTALADYIEYCQFGLNLETAVGMSIYIKPKAGYGINDISVTVTDKDGKAVATTAPAMSGSEIKISIPGLYPEQLLNNYNVTVTVNGVSATYVRSVISCAYSLEQKGKAVSLVEALYQYSLAARGIWG